MLWAMKEFLQGVEFDDVVWYYEHDPAGGRMYDVAVDYDEARAMIVDAWQKELCD